MRIKRTWIWVMAVCLGIAGCADDLLDFLTEGQGGMDGQDKVVSVSTLGDYPPYCFTAEPVDELIETLPPGSDSTIFQGYSWDVFRESFHAEGYTIQLVVTDWLSAMDAVRLGQVDVLFPATKSAERQATFHYSQESVNDASLLVYVPQDSPMQWQGLSSLAGLRIGAMRGYNYGDEWNAESRIEKHEVDTVIEGFRLLDAGELDGFAGYEVNWDYELKQIGWGNKYRKLPVFAATHEYVIGLQTNPKADQLLGAYDAGRQQIVADGTFASIVEAWR